MRVSKRDSSSRRVHIRSKDGLKGNNDVENWDKIKRSTNQAITIIVKFVYTSWYIVSHWLLLTSAHTRANFHFWYLGDTHECSSYCHRRRRNSICEDLAKRTNLHGITFNWCVDWRLSLGNRQFCVLPSTWICSWMSSIHCVRSLARLRAYVTAIVFVFVLKPRETHLQPVDTVNSLVDKLYVLICTKRYCEQNH